MREIQHTRWVPAAGENRINGMIESRPDWVISRQRAWGVPIAVFVRENADGSATILNDKAVNKRIADAFERRAQTPGTNPGARERFLGTLANEALEEGRRHLRRLVRTPARRTPSCWKTPCTFLRSLASSATRTAARML